MFSLVALYTGAIHEFDFDQLMKYNENDFKHNIL